MLVRARSRAVQLFRDPRIVGVPPGPRTAPPHGRVLLSLISPAPAAA
ncbi:hypothetical protein STTU_6449 [Streptomyces sp. Tu6071]|nr:hypothetical protein STTU_6449 [Streptomyces sp. Tu6071]